MALSSLCPARIDGQSQPIAVGRPSARVAASFADSGGEDHAVAQGASQRPGLAHDGAIGRRYSTAIESGTKASSPFINGGAGVGDAVTACRTLSWSRQLNKA
jgi:hypothetical protein